MPIMVHRPEASVTTPRRTDTEPDLAEWRGRCLLAQSLISHRMDPESNPDLGVVLAVLRGELSIVGGE